MSTPELHSNSGRVRSKILYFANFLQENTGLGPFDCPKWFASNYVTIYDSMHDDLEVDTVSSNEYNIRVHTSEVRSSRFL